MEYQILVRDFARRTQTNLKTLRSIQEQFTEHEIFEVTQLINSMLGLLVFPQQRYFNSLPEIPLAELASQGWPIPKVEGSYPQVKDLKQLMRYLRNGIAHFNLEFLTDDKQEVSGIKIWNVRNDRKTWMATLSIEDIEKITERFIDLLLEGEDDQTRSKKA